MGALVCNPSVWEADAGWSPQVQSQTGLQGNTPVVPMKTKYGTTKSHTTKQNNNKTARERFPGVSLGEPSPSKNPQRVPQAVYKSDIQHPLLIRDETNDVHLHITELGPWEAHDKNLPIR